MTAGLYNFTVVQGSTLRRHFVWIDSNGDPQDWTNIGVRAQIRAPLTSPTVLLELNSTDGTIVLSAGGVMDWHVGADVTAGLSWPRLADFDLEFYSLTDPTEVDRKLYGQVNLSLEVTR